MVPDRPDNGDDSPRLKFTDGPAEQRFGGNACRVTRRRFESIYRVGAKVDEVAPGSLKPAKKVVRSEGRIDHQESIPDGAIETRILLVEESSGRRRSLADEQQPHGIRTIAAAEDRLPAPGTTVPLPGTRRLRARQVLNRLAGANRAGLQHTAVEGEFPAEAIDDVPQQPSGRDPVCRDRTSS